jgi:hypothetical protein
MILGGTPEKRSGIAPIGGASRTSKLALKKKASYDY